MGSASVGETAASQGYPVPVSLAALEKEKGQKDRGLGPGSHPKHSLVLFPRLPVNIRPKPDSGFLAPIRRWSTVGEWK